MKHSSYFLTAFALSAAAVSSAGAAPVVQTPAAVTVSSVGVVGDADFGKEVLQSTNPVLVEFGARWCAPCRMLSPMFDTLAARRPALKILRVNVDEDQKMAVRYGVHGLPTLVLFKDGQPVARDDEFFTEAPASADDAAFRAKYLDKLTRFVDERVKTTPAAPLAPARR